MNWSPPPRCGKAAEASLKNAPLLQLFHNVLVQIEIHLSLLCALNRSNSKTVPNFLGRDKPNPIALQLWSTQELPIVFGSRFTLASLAVLNLFLRFAFLGAVVLDTALGRPP